MPRRAFLGLLLGSLACSGPPAAGADAGPPLVGGAIAVPGCAAPLVTPINATAPRPGTDVVGADPSPRLVHLGLPGDPRHTIAITRSTIRWARASTSSRSSGRFPSQC